MPVDIRLQSAKMEDAVKQLMEMMKEIKASQVSQDSKLEEIKANHHHQSIKSNLRG